MRPHHVKIQFLLVPDDQHGYQVESLWAEPLGENRFRILNSPFFVFGISAEDIVEAQTDGDRLRFSQVVSRGGHSTYRIFLQGDHTIMHPEFQRSWRAIAACGCTFENANNRFIAVDVPPDADILEVYRMLQQAESEGIWAFEEGHYGRPEQTSSA